MGNQTVREFHMRQILVILVILAGIFACTFTPRRPGQLTPVTLLCRSGPTVHRAHPPTRGRRLTLQPQKIN